MKWQSVFLSDFLAFRAPEETEVGLSLENSERPRGKLRSQCTCVLHMCRSVWCLQRVGIFCVCGGVFLSWVCVVWCVCMLRGGRVCVCACVASLSKPRSFAGQVNYQQELCLPEVNLNTLGDQGRDGWESFLYCSRLLPRSPPGVHLLQEPRSPLQLVSPCLLSFSFTLPPESWFPPP